MCIINNRRLLISIKSKLASELTIKVAMYVYGVFKFVYVSEFSVHKHK